MTISNDNGIPQAVHVALQFCASVTNILTVKYNIGLTVAHPLLDMPLSNPKFKNLDKIVNTDMKSLQNEKI